MKNILITGALGQIGSELTNFLRERYGVDHVIATDIKQPKETTGPYEVLDVLDGERFLQIANKYSIDTVIHLASLLSATAEAKPLVAWNLNMGGLLNALEVAKEKKAQFFTPSSIGAFGPTTPKEWTPQDTLMRPTTMYGINKVAGELLADYYFTKYHLDTRGLRFPGLISYVTPAGGGTTDYAVDIYYEAIKNKKYTSYIGPHTFMDMMYMPDALEAIVKLMETDSSQLIHRNAYNVSAMSIDPELLKMSIKKVIPEFELTYEVDPVRQSIATSWPDSLDCRCAKEEFGFSPVYDVDSMTKDMLEKLMIKLTNLKG